MSLKLHLIVADFKPPYIFLKTQFVPADGPSWAHLGHSLKSGGGGGVGWGWVGEEGSD